MALGEHPEVISFDEFLEHYKDHRTTTSLSKSLEDRHYAFEANIIKIQQHNAKGLSWRMGVNHFADLTADEWQEEVGTRTCAPSMEQGLKRHEERTVGRLPQVRNPQNAPSVDWRAEGAVTPVKNQGQCGSCWAFSTTGSLEGAWKLAHGSLLEFSEQELVDCDNTVYGCNGGLVDYAFEYIMKNGITTEDIYPYHASDGNCDASKVAQVVATVKDYHDVTPNSVAALENALNVGPVSIAIEADRGAFQLYRGGILSGRAGCGDQLDHAVLLVGYGTESGEDYWIVKNSWGGDWGESGYIRMQKGRDGPGTCGLQKQPSYPIAGDDPNPGPGPTPKPTPAPTPAPGPGPTPSPGPAGGDYSDPGANGSCPMQDIVFRDEYDLAGRMCLPRCNDKLECPPAPSGFAEEPRCNVAPPPPSGDAASLTDVTKTMNVYCGFPCARDSDCGQGTKCVNYYGIFTLCMYI